MCISIPLFYLLPLLMYHFWNKVSVLKQGRSGGDWHLPGEVWNNVGPERLEAQAAKFTRDFAEHGVMWQFAIWLRQFCLIVVGAGRSSCRRASGSRGRLPKVARHRIAA